MPATTPMSRNSAAIEPEVTADDVPDDRGGLADGHRAGPSPRPTPRSSSGSPVARVVLARDDHRLAPPGSYSRRFCEPDQRLEELLVDGASGGRAVLDDRRDQADLLVSVLRHLLAHQVAQHEGAHEPRPQQQDDGEDDEGDGEPLTHRPVPPSRRNPTPRTATTRSVTPTLSSFWRSRPIVTSSVLVEPYQFSSHTSAISRPRETTLSRLAARMFEHLELLAGERDLLGAGVDPPGLDVDPHPVGGLLLGAAAGGGTAQQGAHARLQLGQAEGLGQVVVGPVVEPDHPVELAGPRGDDHDRPLEAGLAGPSTDLEPVDVGQPEVQDHQIGRRREGVEGLLAALHPLDVVALALQGADERERDVLLVLHHQDPLRHGSEHRGHGACSCDSSLTVSASPPRSGPPFARGGRRRGRRAAGCSGHQRARPAAPRRPPGAATGSGSASSEVGPADPRDA